MSQLLPQLNMLSGTQNNPIYTDSFSTIYHKTLSKTPYSVIDFQAIKPDYKVLFYAIANRIPTLSAASNQKLAVLAQMKAQSTQTSTSILDQLAQALNTSKTDHTNASTDSNTK